MIAPGGGRPAVLVVDDDASVTAALALVLKRGGYAPKVAAAPEEALALLAAGSFDLVLQDMNFGRATTGEEGLALLRAIRARRPDLPVILITAWGSIDLAVAGMRAGARDFLTKPWSNARVLEALATALAVARGGESSGDVRREALEDRWDVRGLVGTDPALLRLLDRAGRVADSDASVLVLGESGTGKELVAAFLHRNSRRRSGPFVKVNLGGIPATLFESEMFGHVRGAFTDARADRQGRFSLAAGGTIFLDEVGELEPAAQVKLLRVLQERTYEVLGSSVPRTVDVRVVAATNRDLPTLARQGEFREDLLYRLNLVTLRLPPLRERSGDVPRLAEHFLREASAARGRELVLAADALDWLRAQPWPGNVRQLRQTIERAVLLLEGPRLRSVDLAALAAEEDTPVGSDELPAPGAMTLDEVERAMIERALQRFGGNLTRTAEALGLSRPALYRRLDKHGLGGGER